MSPQQIPEVPVDRLNQWLAALNTYDVQFLVVDKLRDSVLLDLIQSQPDWGTDFEDEDIALLARIPMRGAA